MARAKSKLYTNGEIEKYFSEGEPIPEGFFQSKIIYINDGKENKRWVEGKELPSGFVLGKLPLSRNWDESKHKHHSEETKQKISMAKQGKGAGKDNPFYGKHHTQETKNHISLLAKSRPHPKGRTLTEEQKIARDKKIIEKWGSLEEFHKYCSTKVKQTKLERYGNPNYNNREKSAATTFSHFGVDYFCMTDEFRKGHGNTSSYNSNFARLLQAYGLYESDELTKEFPLHNRLYDFKVGNTLIEINPSVTHNSTFGVYNDPPKDRHYHQDKSKLAFENGYVCVHIWDWDSPELLLQRFIIKETVYARSCDVRLIEDKQQVKEFLNENHLQGNCNNQSVCLGLFYKDELVQLMTFGTPRYNKKYEYELLRLCTKVHYKIVGGAERLFKHFIRDYAPKSIISYCDNSKFQGNVYNTLGFTRKAFGEPSRHWYNMSTGQHITDNLLRQRGFDQLFGTNYGKGTSNEELMRDNGFVEIYDCGQSVYEYILNKEKQ